jgi:hypothetical protein
MKAPVPASAFFFFPSSSSSSGKESRYDVHEIIPVGL